MGGGKNAHRRKRPKKYQEKPPKRSQPELQSSPRLVRSAGRWALWVIYALLGTAGTHSIGVVFDAWLPLWPVRPEFLADADLHSSLGNIENPSQFGDAAILVVHLLHQMSWHQDLSS